MNLFSTLICAAAVALFPSWVAAQGVVFREDFESGAPGWTFGGVWHVEPDTTICGAQVAPFPSPGHCAWYGGSTTIGSTTLCDYNFGSVGAALVRATPVLLPANPGSLVLRYRRFLDTEHCIGGYDITRVRVTTNGGQTLLAQGSDCASEPGWTDRRIDLSAHAGVPVELRFELVPTDMVFNETFGWCIDDVEIAAEPGVATCTASTSCPCSFQWNFYNSPTNGVQANEDAGGCKHSAWKEALLFANGVQSVSADTVALVVHDLPQSTVALYVQGLTTQASLLGDGRRCVGGSLVRMAVHNVSNGQDAYPLPGEPGVALRGQVPAGGGSRSYQVVYRDAVSYCTPSTFNTSNGYVIAWHP